MSVPRKTAQRFDQVFLVRMIGEFFLALLIVAVLELAIRFGLVFYHFETEEVENTRQAAESLASRPTASASSVISRPSPATYWAIWESGPIFRPISRNGGRRSG